MFGPVVTVVKMTIAIAMAMLLPCGPFPSIPPLILEKMLIMMKVVRQLWHPLSLMELKIPTPEW